MPTGGDMMDFATRLFEEPEELHEEARRKCDKAKRFIKQAIDVGADTIVSACQQCRRALLGAVQSMRHPIKVLDVAELVYESIRPREGP